MGEVKARTMKETLETMLKAYYYKTSLCKVFPTYEDFIQKFLYKRDKKSVEIIKEIAINEIPDLSERL